MLCYLMCLFVTGLIVAVKLPKFIYSIVLHHSGFAMPGLYRSSIEQHELNTAQTGATYATNLELQDQQLG